MNMPAQPRSTKGRRLPRVLVAVALGAGLLRGSAVRADGLADEAELHFQIGVERYQKGEFWEALEHFLASNCLVPNKNVIFNIARIFEQMKRYADAHRYYIDALAIETNPQTVGDIQSAIRRIAPNVAVIDVE